MRSLILAVLPALASLIQGSRIGSELAALIEVQPPFTGTMPGLFVNWPPLEQSYGNATITKRRVDNDTDIDVPKRRDRILRIHGKQPAYSFNVTHPKLYHHGEDLKLDPPYLNLTERRHFAKRNTDCVSLEFTAATNVTIANETGAAPGSFDEYGPWWETSFLALDSAVESNTYLDMFVLDEYEPEFCIAICNEDERCMGINIFVERSPVVVPGPNCPNPPGMAVVKCVLFGSAVTTESATNKGRFLGPKDADGKAFHALIESSNDYSRRAPYIRHFIRPYPFNGLPNEEIEDKELIDIKFYNQVYNPTLCAEVCTNITAVNKAKARMDAEVGNVTSPIRYTSCNSFSAFVIENHGVPAGMGCLFRSGGGAPLEGNTTATDVGDYELTFKNVWAYDLRRQGWGRI
ncbi:hypothetical protein W97_01398 [Coniosporium apollinis CBS 100218]|uniref:Uncharacterized protein n=1 Tax=Coniosporium apollinis (strain CBS 100218) TaxID=1168221 RepID=R7YJX8_CONA1|nr:uncharacterized protein W97_01398 [Coniosporium apollinis CBS 100218]EON62178.1 hypothetical protein W97_01398 [Coniosporium apollinis CBS 100218]